jgi:hypothetical protein
VGQLVTIKRAPLYTFQVDGKVKEVRTWDEKVGTIVEKSKTKLNPNDIVSPGLNAKVASGALIKITRINYAQVTETKSIPFETIYQGSTALALGQSKSSVSGIIGSKKITYKITYKDGNEVSRVIISSSIIQQKRDATILRGAVTGVCKWGKYYETNSGPYTTAFHYPGYRGRYILVTNLTNGKSVKVKVVDVGPTNGLLDLSTTAINQIGGMTEIYNTGYMSSVMVQIID